MMQLHTKQYKLVTFLVQIALPATATLYLTLSGIWGLPWAEQIVATIVALSLFLGVILGVSTKNYYDSDDRFDGDLVVEPGAEKDVMRFELNDEPIDLGLKDELLFKVERPTSDI